jgi:hypothetical protein
MKINNFEIENVNGLTEFVAIDDGNGTTTIIPKSVYDEMIAKQESLSK